MAEILHMAPPARAAPRPVVLAVSVEAMAFAAAPVLGRIRLTLHEGETMAITGPSGIGKSTLLRIAAGLERRAEARVELHGKLSMVFQEPTLLAWRSLASNLRIAARIGRAEAEAALEEVGLAGLGARYPGEVSLGQRRRLALARAFATAPDILLMDEPFVSLDPVLHGEMMALFARMRARRGTATLLVTHDAQEAERLAGTILTLGGQPAVVTETRRSGGPGLPIALPEGSAALS